MNPLLPTKKILDRKNGQSPWIILAFIAIGAVVLGYAQACADSNAKNFFQKLDEEKYRERFDANPEDFRNDRAKSYVKRRGKSSVRTPNAASTYFGFEEPEEALRAPQRPRAASTHLSTQGNDDEYI